MAIDAYHRFDEDLRLVASLGFRANRFSISWPRVLGDGRGPRDAKGGDFYDRVIDGCLARGIEPWVTVHHWDMPLALGRAGGWTRGGIVEDFAAVFASLAEELPILAEVYRELRSRVLAELERDPSAPQLSAELTRLVQAFEDPRSLGEVRTLHGLKRYLHQRGLRLGFRLVEAGRSTNRSIDLLLAAGGRALRKLAAIGYVDFETPAGAGSECSRPPPPCSTPP